MTITLLPANKFSLELLAQTYTQARKNYLVPMPMSADRLREYIRVYQIELQHSLVAVEGDVMVGIGMLGLRQKRSWVTRLGVLAEHRGKGIGEKVTKGLLEISDDLGIPHNQVEVITGNEGAHRLFRKLGFKESRELLILDCPASEAPQPTVKADWLDRQTCLAYLEARQEPQAWTNQAETVHQVNGIQGIEIDLPEFGRGWLVFQKTSKKLSRLMFETSCPAVMHELLVQIHAAFPGLDANIENVRADALELPILEEFGYCVSFRRIEMARYPVLK